MWTWLLLPVVIALLFGFTLGLSMILSSLYPRFRDIGIIWTVVATALFYATPVLYPLEKVSGRLRDLIAINPITPILGVARKWIIDPHAPAPRLGGGRRADAPADRGRHLRRDLRSRGVDLQPRGAADRRRALTVCTWSVPDGWQQVRNHGQGSVKRLPVGRRAGEGEPRLGVLRFGAHHPLQDRLGHLVITPLQRDLRPEHRYLAVGIQEPGAVQQ